MGDPCSVFLFRAQSSRLSGVNHVTAYRTHGEAVELTPHWCSGGTVWTRISPSHAVCSTNPTLDAAYVQNPYSNRSPKGGWSLLTRSLRGGEKQPKKTDYSRVANLSTRLRGWGRRKTSCEIWLQLSLFDYYFFVILNCNIYIIVIWTRFFSYRSETEFNLKLTLDARNIYIYNHVEV